MSRVSSETLEGGIKYVSRDSNNTVFQPVEFLKGFIDYIIVTFV